MCLESGALAYHQPALDPRPDYALDPKLAAKIKEAFYSFKIQGTSVGKDFRDATHFIPIALVERLTVMENVLTGRLGYVSLWPA